MLWTRAEPLKKTNVSLHVTLEVSFDEQFSSLIVQDEYQVGSDSDYTMRILVESLTADTTYYYRFICRDQVSTTGRTRTAPDTASNTEIRFAFMSCQERKHGFYNAYRNLIDTDQQAGDEEKIRFILHLGDFIYETRNDTLQTPVDDLNQDLAEPLTDDSGLPRTLLPFVDGGTTSDGIEFSDSLADYRQLYKQYLADPDLQAARARWPFVVIWDDHEFSDDCWQTEANYENSGIDISTNEPSQARKLAANQAWFEFTPANLTPEDDLDSDLWHAHDFETTEVGTSTNDLIDEQNQVINEDNLKAIGSLTIYRSLKFGQLLQVILTDNRSYRSDHAIPEDLTGNIDLFFSDRVGLPLELVNALDAGRTANDNDPDTFLFLGSFILNPRRFSPPGTILGSSQKDWLKKTLRRSDNQWKIWGNSVPLLRFLLNLSALDSSISDLILSADSWDGYDSERKEMMQFLYDESIRNVISLSGDLHAHFAGEVWTDYDDDEQDKKCVMVEAVCTAVSSVSQFSAVEKLIHSVAPSTLESTVKKLVSFRQIDESGEHLINNLNNLLLNGVNSALAAEAGQTQQVIVDNKDSNVNPHLKYADTDAHGYGIAHVQSDRVIIDLITIEQINQKSQQASMEKRRARFIIPKTESGQNASISAAEITGTAPFPYE